MSPINWFILFFYFFTLYVLLSFLISYFYSFSVHFMWVSNFSVVGWEW